MKCYWHGTQRTVAPGETLEQLRPHFPRIGLTRLADITGLDRIGIPVVLSVRPNAGYLALDAGKGVTLEAARVSAAMECLERHHAETIVLPVLRCSYEELSQVYPVIPLAQLPLTKHSLFSPRLREQWVLGWDIMSDQESAVPAGMVPMDRFKYGRADLVPFQTGSNGLASGNHLLEALESGLLEVIERDAVTCHMVALRHGATSIPRIRLDTIASPLVQGLLQRFEAAGVAPLLFDCRVDTGVPVFMAYIYDRLVRHIGVCRGYGAHLHPEIAMARALTEAAQSRLVYIAGSRDDMFRRSFLRMKQGDYGAQIDHIEAIPETVDARGIPSQATATFEGDVHCLLGKLRDVGLEHTIVFDLSQSDDPFAVLRVIVPGLEGYMFDYYVPGSRARAFVARRAA